MKNIFFLLSLFFSSSVISQNTLPIDTIKYKAMQPGGYKDTNINFKQFISISTDSIIYTTDNLLAKITFINFWFEGCPPCIAEFEALNNLYNKYKTNKDFQFLSFTFETSKDALRIANKYHLEYPILLMEKKYIYNLNLNNGFPTTIITDKLGKISFIKCGGFIEEEKAKEEVDSLYSKEIDRLLLIK